MAGTKKRGKRGRAKPVKKFPASTATVAGLAFRFGRLPDDLDQI